MYPRYLTFSLLGALTLAVPGLVNPPQFRSRSIGQHSDTQVSALGQILGKRQESVGQDHFLSATEPGDNFVPGVSNNENECHCSLDRKGACYPLWAINKCTKAAKCRGCTCDPHDPNDFSKPLCDDDCRICSPKGSNEINQRCDKCPFSCSDNHCPCFGFALNKMFCGFDFDAESALPRCTAYRNELQPAINAEAKKNPILNCGDGHYPGFRKNSQDQLQVGTETAANPAIVPNNESQDGDIETLIDNDAGYSKY